MAKFPIDAPKKRVLNSLQSLGFVIVREGNHIAMKKVNADGSVTTLTLPNHSKLKASTLRSIIAQAGISRDAFLADYEKS